MESSFRLWGSTEGDLIHPADCMHELLDQVRRHKVNIDGNVTTVMVTTLVLEVCCADLMLISITSVTITKMNWSKCRPLFPPTEYLNYKFVC